MANLISWVPRINITRILSVTPTITSGSAYVSGYQLGGIMSIPLAVREEFNSLQGQSQLVDITVLDNSSQNSAIDFFLFSSLPTLASSDHSAFDITDANLVATCIGVVSILGTTYSGTASNSVSSTTNLGKIIQVPSTKATPATTLYVVAVARGTPTYTSTTALQFQFGLYID